MQSKYIDSLNVIWTQHLFRPTNNQSSSFKLSLHLKFVTFSLIESVGSNIQDVWQAFGAVFSTSFQQPLWKSFGVVGAKY
jgi:hypothetical protein